MLEADTRGLQACMHVVFFSHAEMKFTKGTPSFCSNSHLHCYPSGADGSEKSLGGIKKGATHWLIGFLKKQ